MPIARIPGVLRRRGNFKDAEVCGHANCPSAMSGCERERASRMLKLMGLPIARVPWVVVKDGGGGGLQGC